MAFSNNFYIVIMGLCLASVWGAEIIKTVIDKFSLPGAERELERKLLLDLEAIIARNRMSS